ncbi:MAG: hypothetical protein [Avonheates virus SG_120]|uniref:hypothetical protein n=1 Tax=Avonheates virus SG_120 TaxID=2914480 RepID=UPI002481ED89|nr:MAG: hypothetical protein QKV62_gp2 [Avonheates virus SG_120]UNI72625.1 MAG: hypothetical protein [Avonheates virus SG_120]
MRPLRKLYKSRRVRTKQGYRARSAQPSSMAIVPRAKARQINYGSRAPVKSRESNTRAYQTNKVKNKTYLHKVNRGTKNKKIRKDPRPTSTKKVSRSPADTSLVVHDLRDYDNTTATKKFSQIDKAEEGKMKRLASGYQKWETRIEKGINATANVVDKMMGVVNPILDATAVADPMNVPLAVAGNALEAVDHLIKVTSDSHQAVKKTVEGGKALKAMVSQGDPGPLMLMNVPAVQ